MKVKALREKAWRQMTCMTRMIKNAMKIFLTNKENLNKVKRLSVGQAK